jgi:hypothetical protein
MSETPERNIRAYHMYQSGSIPGLPNPNAQSGLWPGGIVVYVDMDTMEVLSTGLIGGPAPAPDPATSPELLRELAHTLEEATTLEHEIIDQSNDQ